jgi:glycosyltransferase involved in cell wall biosynthesis
MPKVSVIIPVYNTAPYPQRCLDSVCGQTLRDLKFIYVNDASTDEGADILRYALTGILPLGSHWFAGYGVAFWRRHILIPEPAAAAAQNL